MLALIPDQDSELISRLVLLVAVVLVLASCGPRYPLGMSEEEFYSLSDSEKFKVRLEDAKLRGKQALADAEEARAKAVENKAKVIEARQERDLLAPEVELRRLEAEIEAGRLIEYEERRKAEEMKRRRRAEMKKQQQQAEEMETLAQQLQRSYNVNKKLREVVRP